MGTLRLRLAEGDRNKMGLPEWLEFDETSLTVHEAREIRKKTGYRTTQFFDELSAIDADALAAFVWLMARRLGIDLTYSDVDFAIVAIDMLDDKDWEKKLATDAAALEEAQRTGNPTVDLSVLENPT